jgi:hypothetical protein
MIKSNSLCVPPLVFKSILPVANDLTSHLVALKEYQWRVTLSIPVSRDDKVLLEKGLPPAGQIDSMGG